MSDKINEVFESVYSDITEFDKKYFKTHGRYFRTDTVIAFGGFKEALQYKDPEIKKLRDVLEEVYKMYAYRLDNFSIKLKKGEGDLIYKIAELVRYKDGK